MTQERYQRINAVADAALDLPKPERSEFLLQACEGDGELLREVNELLGVQETGAAFMEAPLLDQLAQDLAEGADGHDLSGKQFHHYRIQKQLGTGGLGEVWLAEDTRLGREVALKLLSRVSAADPLQVQRFQREARTASSLNHPNIVTIYEIGIADDYEFIAQECVKGETLRQRLQGGPMPMETVLHAGTQIAAALAAAHGAGIVHRDIKPENIMLRPDGLVKVLDFGLARFIESTTSSRAANLSITRPGIVLGTARYMSPEQARGLPIDARSDIFSLGAVLYEMASGTAPFHGRTDSDLIAAILAVEPEPISLRLKGVPQAFEATVNRCLQKDPAQRYQDAQELQRDLELTSHSGRRSAEIATGGPRPSGRSTRSWWKIAVLAVALVLALAAMGAYFVRKSRASEPSFNSVKMTRLFVRGRVQDAAISKDGESVVYFLNEPNGQSLWIRQVSSSLQSRILPPERSTHTGLAFSASGRYVSWLRQTAGGGSSLYRLALHELGKPVCIRDDLHSAVAFSPDGDWYTYIRLDGALRQSTLMVSSVDGTVVRAIDTRRGANYFSRYGLAWAPDGHSIACFVGHATGYTDQAFHLVSVRLTDGNEKPFGSHYWLWAGSVSWPVQNRIFVNATEALDDAYQISAVSTRDGSVTRITNDLSNHSRVSAASSGGTVLALQTQTAVDLWVVAGANSERAVQITSGDVSGFNSLAWTPDNHIVYSAIAGEYRNLWVVNSDGSELKEVTTGPENKQEPAVTPDGKYIVYHSDGAIWRMDIDGKNSRRLTFGTNDTHPEPSADGRYVLYASFRNWTPGLGGTPTLWRVSIDGGQPTSISNLPASVPKLSPDGRLMASEYFPGGDPQLSRDDVAIMGPDGGSPLKVFNRLPATRSFVSWAPDSGAIEWSASDGGFDNVWRQALSGGDPQTVTHFRGSSIAAYAWSRDGRKLAVARTNTTRDIVLIRAAE